MHYERILAAVAATPWAIEPNKGRELGAILSRRIRDGESPAADIEAARAIAAAREERKAKPRPSGVAVIPLHGVMIQRADWFMETSGILSTEQVGQLVDQAADDPSVEAIILDVDSPGGSVFGTEELAGKLADATKQKKVIAVANAVAASGAYYVASQASELVVSPSGQVGSIGVFMMHVDRSEELRQAGLTVTFVASSQRKVAGNQYSPLDPVGRDEMEQQVSGYYDLFVKAVARGRSTTQTNVREKFGGGGMVLAEQAVKLGMADRVATLDDVLGRYGLRAADLTPAAQVDRSDIEIRKRRLALD
ncbi:MAG TPA: S49 family peptidase [Gemmataceae bacterium]|nr:S49 family peptidase [Gemmataceae bacterium]